jgi:hypothetical protein
MPDPVLVAVDEDAGALRDVERVSVSEGDA